MTETDRSVVSGIGIGTVIAVCCSWSANHSILWAAIHGCIGWLYVLYWAVFK